MEIFERPTDIGNGAMLDEPEISLATACCRFAYRGDGMDKIRRLSRQVDWPRFLELVGRHRVQGLVNSALRKGRILPPEPVGPAISGDASASAEHNLRSALESMRLLEAFADAGIPLLFVKGLTLSALAYGDPYLKSAADIDLLVEADSLDRAAALLRQTGYVLFLPPLAANLRSSLPKWHERRKESLWLKTKTSIAIDLHTRLANNPALIPRIGMDAPKQDVPIGPSKSLPTLASDELLVYLCVHGASSAWFRLKWISDLAALVHRRGADLERLHRQAQAQRAGRASAQALLLANRLGLLDVPSGLRRELKSDPVNRLLANIALRELLQPGEPTKRRLGTARIHLSQIFLLPGWRFKLSEAMRQVQDVADTRYRHLQLQ